MVAISSRSSGGGKGKWSPSTVIVCCIMVPVAMFGYFGFKIVSRSTMASGRSLVRQGATFGDDIHIVPILRHLGMYSDLLYEKLLNDHPQPSPNSIVIEVGCFNIEQSLKAAQNGFRTYSIEASPANYQRMMNKHKTLDKKTSDLITVINKAASAKSNQVLTFDSIGGTGDHVSGMNLDAAQERKYDANPNSRVQVKSTTLDDLIQSFPPESHVYLTKVDVQGHEASVFQGMKESIRQGKVRYILFEYWVDALDQAAGLPSGSCSSVESILRPMHDAGYTLYDLSVFFHPGANDPKTSRAHWDKWFRPLEAREHCQWFANLGERGRKELNYEMGYWTDILAVYGGDFGQSEKGPTVNGGRAPKWAGK